MNPVSAAFWEARRLSKNPIHPFRWRAEYRDGGAVAQFEPHRYNTSARIDRARLKHLVVLNHPRSPILIEPPFPSPPDEVIIMASVDVKVRLGSSSVAGRGLTYFFGYRYGGERFLTQITPSGEVRAVTSGKGEGAWRRRKLAR